LVVLALRCVYLRPLVHLDFAVAMLKRIILDGVVLAVMLTGAAAAG
jgi:hypothetical protein